MHIIRIKTSLSIKENFHNIKNFILNVTFFMFIYYILDNKSYNLYNIDFRDLQTLKEPMLLMTKMVFALIVRIFIYEKKENLSFYAIFIVPTCISGLLFLQGDPSLNKEFSIYSILFITAVIISSATIYITYLFFIKKPLTNIEILKKLDDLFSIPFVFCIIYILWYSSSFDELKNYLFSFSNVDLDMKNKNNLGLFLGMGFILFFHMPLNIREQTLNHCKIILCFSVLYIIFSFSMNELKQNGYIRYSYITFNLIIVFFINVFSKLIIEKNTIRNNIYSICLKILFLIYILNSVLNFIPETIASMSLFILFNLVFFKEKEKGMIISLLYILIILSSILFLFTSELNNSFEGAYVKKDIPGLLIISLYLINGLLISKEHLLLKFKNFLQLREELKMKKIPDYLYSGSEIKKQKKILHLIVSKCILLNLIILIFIVSAYQFIKNDIQLIIILTTIINLIFLYFINFDKILLTDEKIIVVSTTTLSYIVCNYDEFKLENDKYSKNFILVHKNFKKYSYCLTINKSERKLRKFISKRMQQQKNHHEILT